MSVAFTKEDSAQTASETMLPDRPISPEPNLVTQAGLAELQTQLEDARLAYAAASAIEDIDERRRQSAIPLRDLRYFTERLRSAQLVQNPDALDVVAFGAIVTFSGDDGRERRYRIVGEDEADPKAGSMSYASPVARLLVGRGVGDVVTLGNKDLEIIAISQN